MSSVSVVYIQRTSLSEKPTIKDLSSQLALFHYALVGTIETLFEKKNLPLLKRADLEST